MPNDNKIPLTGNEKTLIGKYLKDIQEMRNLLTVKGQALDDVLGVIIEARGLSSKDYVVDIRQGAIVKRGGENVRPGEEEKARESQS